MLQSASHVYRSTPPVCIAIRLHLYCNTLGKVLVVVVTGMLPIIFFLSATLVKNIQGVSCSVMIFRNAHLFIILFVLNFGRVCSLVWLRVRNSV